MTKVTRHIFIAEKVIIFSPESTNFYGMVEHDPGITHVGLSDDLDQYLAPVYFPKFLKIAIQVSLGNLCSPCTFLVHIT